MQFDYGFWASIAAIYLLVSAIQQIIMNYIYHNQNCLLLTGASISMAILLFSSKFHRTKIRQTEYLHVLIKCTKLPHLY